MFEMRDDKDGAAGAGAELFGAPQDGPGGAEMFGAPQDAPGGAEMFGAPDAPGGAELFGGPQDGPGGAEMFGAALFTDEPVPAPAAPQAPARGGRRFTAPIAFAFQPIWDAEAGEIHAQEALLRTPSGAGPESLFAQITPENIYSFDQRARIGAVEAAAAVGLTGPLCINFIPDAVYEPDRCLLPTLSAARQAGFAPEDLIFEVVETGRVVDPLRLLHIVDGVREMGCRVALDDFGGGGAGLSLLADLRPDLVKLDRAVSAGIDADPGRRAVVRAMQDICAELGVDLVAEGLERPEEIAAMRDLGVTLLQGYAVARPVFRDLVPAQEIRDRLAA